MDKHTPIDLIDRHLSLTIDRIHPTIMESIVDRLQAGPGGASIDVVG